MTALCRFNSEINRFYFISRLTTSNNNNNNNTNNDNKNFYSQNRDNETKRCKMFKCKRSSVPRNKYRKS